MANRLLWRCSSRGRHAPLLAPRGHLAVLKSSTGTLPSPLSPTPFPSLLLLCLQPAPAAAMAAMDATSWSSCMSRRSYIRRRLPYGPPPAQPRPLAGAHGRLEASPPLSRRRRASSSELLCRPLCNRDRGPRVTIETSPGGFLQNRRLK